jgi:hypothetical protein
MAITYNYTGEQDSYRRQQETLELLVVVANTPAYYKMATITAVKKVLLQAPGPI